MYIAITSALGATLWAMFRTYRVIGKTSGMTHGVPVRKIKLCVSALIVILLLLSYAFASTAPIHINTTEYADAFWLRIANMLVTTGILAIITATAATIYNIIKARQ